MSTATRAVKSAETARDAGVELRTSPHLRNPITVDYIMRHVVYALVPVATFAVYNFGISAAALLGVCITVALLTEHIYCRIVRRATTIGDWSVVVTGVLTALILPPALPLWMAAVTTFFGVAIGKLFFGGLGFNAMNPALVGRAFAQAAFTSPMTTWTPPWMADRFTEFIPSSLTLPFLQPRSIAEWLDTSAPMGFTGATPLTRMISEGTGTDTMQLLYGTIAGSTGETSALFILLGGLYLLIRKFANWRVPVSVLGTVAALSGAFHISNPDAYPDPVFMLLAGSVMFGAFFLATDPVSSPETRTGLWIYGILIGVLVVVIRLFGGLSEGVMYAILLANAATPIISRLTQPRVYGTGRRNKPEKDPSHE